MSAYQFFFATVALSLPIVTLIAIGRSLRAKRLKLALFSLLGVAGLLSILLVAAVLWFGYGVAHSQKDLRTDLMLLVITGIPIYAGAYGVWRLAVNIENRLEKDVA